MSPVEIEIVGDRLVARNDYGSFVCEPDPLARWSLMEVIEDAIETLVGCEEVMREKEHLVKTKTEHLLKLMNYLNLTTFEVPDGPYASSIQGAVCARVPDPMKMVNKDIVDIRIDASAPTVIKVHAANESPHNGSEFNRYDATIPVFDEFLDFAIKVLRNRAYGEIESTIKAEEAARLRKQVESRMKELGLLDTSCPGLHNREVMNGVCLECGRP